MFKRIRLSVLVMSVCAGGFLVCTPVAQARSTTDGSTDFASIATVTTTTTGPTDATFNRQEAKFNAPLEGTDAWHGFFSQGGRDLTIDLTYDRPIQSISIEMEQRPDWGVYYPSHVDFELNSGGTWYELGSQATAIPNTDGKTSTEIFSISCNSLEGHLLRIHFPVSKWVFARHLKIIGNSFATPGSQPLPNLTKVPPAFQSPMQFFDERDAGIKNMLLAYSGSYGNYGTWTEQDFLPVTAYQLPNGEVGGRMFDTVLFLPYGNLKDTQDAWQAYIQNLFAPNEQLAALDAAVADTNAGMRRFGGNSDQTENVVIGIPYPKFNDKVWGKVGANSLNFSGNSADPAAVEARLAALTWYVNTVSADFANAHYAHLHLAGWYWVNEAVNYTSPGEGDLLTGASQIVHALHQPLFWIPYYDAPGLEDWQQNGFDAAWLQPNFVFQGKYADSGRLTNSEQLATVNGLGVELEMPYQTLSDPVFQALYLQSISQFERDGFAGNVSHAFYAGSKVLTAAAHSTNPNERALYDATYGFLTDH